MTDSVYIPYIQRELGNGSQCFIVGFLLQRYKSLRFHANKCK